MHFPNASPAWGPHLLLLPVLFTTSFATASSKRGLCYVPNSTTPEDNTIWVQSPTDLTWYYNYGASPSTVFSNLTQDAFAFVPMLWGAPSSASDTSFLNTVEGLLQKGMEISHIMTFNEPDFPTKWGGSQVDPALGAQVWIRNVVPLQEMGLKVGLPAMSSSAGGLPWLRQFLGNCSEMMSRGRSADENCTYDFVPLHYYGNFEGLASHIGEYVATFPNTSIWVTEFNYNDQPLQATQDFYHSSTEYLDRLPYIERYSFFGAFRADVSNVGFNAAMLSDGGELTDIGMWYLGRDGPGVAPDQGESWSDQSAASRLTSLMSTLFVTLLVFAVFF